MFLVFVLTPAALGLLISAIACWGAKQLFARATLVDAPGSEAHKRQATSVPYGGGAGMAVAMILTVILVHLTVGDAFNLAGERPEPLWPIGISAFCLFALGLLDDRRPLPAWLKLVVQFLAVAVSVVGSGLRVDLFQDLPWLSYGIAALWCVLVTNAFNLLDHADGLSATTAIISLIVLVSAALNTGDVQLGLIYLSAIGVLGGFLVWNMPPARIYMGDAGSLPLGFLIATGCLLVTFWDTGDLEGGTSLALLAPLLVTAIPLYDTAVVMFKRLAHRRRLMQGDRNHISHRLVRLGLSPRASLAAVAALQTTLAASALLLRKADATTALIVVLQATSVLIAAILLEARRDRFDR